jgi:hypothetical protein
MSKNCAISLRTCTIALLLSIGAMSLGSCNILVPVAYIVKGLPDKEAEYHLADRATLVFVDDQKGKTPRTIRQGIANKVSTDLMVKNVVTKTISSTDAMALAAQKDKAGELLPIESIGQSVGAEQVIYVELNDFTLSIDGATPRPYCACRVRVIDVPNRVRLFPSPENPEPGRQMEISMPAVSVDYYESTATRRKLETMLADYAGDQIGKLFYKHTPDDIGSRLNPDQ